MKQLIEVIGFILITILVVKFIVYAIPFFLVGGLIIWLYFKYIRPAIINKKVKKYSKTTKDSKHKDDVIIENQDDLYDGPVIDVEYEEVDEKTKKDKK